MSNYQHFDVETYPIFEREISYADLMDMMRPDDEEAYSVSKIWFYKLKHAEIFCTNEPRCKLGTPVSIDPYSSPQYPVEPPEGYYFDLTNVEEEYFQWRFEIAEFTIDLDVPIFKPNPNLNSEYWLDEIGGFDATYEDIQAYFNFHRAEGDRFATINRIPKPPEEIKRLLREEGMSLARLNDNVIVIYFEGEEEYAGAIVSDGSKTWLHTMFGSKAYKRFIV